MNPCKCQHWARSFSVDEIPTNHHPNCEHYNDSLIDVWKVSDGSCSYYTDSENDARQQMVDCGVDAGLVVTQEKMHREVFEHMPEFNGF